MFHFNHWWPVWAYVVITMLCSVVYWLVPAGMFVFVLDYKEALYFSLVTGTTLGYGDIAPIHGFTRSIAAGQAVSGPVLLAFFVSKTLYKQQLNDQEKKENEKRQMLYGQLYKLLTIFLSDIEVPRTDEVVTLRFKGVKDHLDVRTQNYDPGRSNLALNHNIRLQMKYPMPQEKMLRDIHISRIPTIYKPALTELTRSIVNYTSVDTVLPMSVSLASANVFRSANELVLDMDKSMNEIFGVEGLDGSNLGENWDINKIQRLKFIELSVYELLANIESDAQVGMLEAESTSL